MSEQTAAPIARSPIAPVPPVAIFEGWEVSTRATDAALTISDQTPQAKVQLKGDAAGLPAFGHVDRKADGSVVVGSGPDEWLFLGGATAAAELAAAAEGARGQGFSSVCDISHGRAMMRVTGAASRDLLAKVCAIDLRDHVTPDGSALRTSVAKLVTDVIRDDVDGTPSFLLHCDRSSGQYLFDALLDAGAEFDIDIRGYQF